MASIGDFNDRHSQFKVYVPPPIDILYAAGVVAEHLEDWRVLVGAIDGRTRKFTVFVNANNFDAAISAAEKLLPRLAELVSMLK